MKPFTMGCEGHLIGSKTKNEKSWALPVQSAHDVFWKKKLEPYDFNCKEKGQNQAINLNVPYSFDSIPDGELVLEAFKFCPFVRVSTIPKVKAVYGSNETWHPCKYPPKYAFQLDKDDCKSIEEVNEILSFGEWIGANGAVWREKKTGVWSVNVVFHFSDYMYKEFAKNVINDVLKLLKEETGVTMDDGGSRNDLIKNIWAIRNLVEDYNNGFRVSFSSWEERGPKNGMWERHHVFSTEDSDPMKFDEVLNSNFVVWNEDCIGSWKTFHGKILKELQEIEGDEREGVRNETTILEQQKEIQEALTPTTFVLPKPKNVKTPYEHFPNYGKGRHDTISVLWKADLKACWKKHGHLPWNETVEIYNKWDKEAGVITGKGSYGKKGMAWLGRNWKTLNAKKPAWLTSDKSSDKETNLGMLKRVAGKLLRIAKLAIDLNIEGRIKDAAEEVLSMDEFRNCFYLQTVINKKVSRTTEWRYKELLKDETKFRVMMEDVLGQACDDLNETENELVKALGLIRTGMMEERVLEMKQPSENVIKFSLQDIETVSLDYLKVPRRTSRWEKGHEPVNWDEVLPKIYGENYVQSKAV